jgi:hypothetical protein
MPQGPTEFCSTVVKPYFTEEPEPEPKPEPEPEPKPEVVEVVQRRQGRPQGSRNKAQAEIQEPCRSGCQQTVKHNDQFVTTMTFMTCKE